MLLSFLFRYLLFEVEEYVSVGVTCPVAVRTARQSWSLKDRVPRACVQAPVIHVQGGRGSEEGLANKEKTPGCE